MGSSDRTPLPEALLHYLRQPGFDRLWPRVKDKLERMGRVGGNVRLSHLTAAERAAIGGLLAKNLYGQADCTVSLRELDTALRQTRFGVPLETCLEGLFAGGLQSRREVREIEAAAWSAFCAWARPQVPARLAGWVDQLEAGLGSGARAFRACFTEYQERGTSASWTAAARALTITVREDVTVTTVRLPILAARATGDAHGLDRSTVAGRLFFWGLTALDEVAGAQVADRADGADRPDLAGGEEEAPVDGVDTDAVRGRYMRFGVVSDDISSVVWAVGIPGVAPWPTALTLWSLEQAPEVTSGVYSAARAARAGRVYVVENPSIFGALVDAARSRPFPCPIVCPSGQPSLAAIRLFDDLVAAGATLHYSGDFDPAGLQIAAALAARYGDALVFWRMRPADYLRVTHPGLPKMSAAERDRLRNVQLPADDTLLVAAMLQRGVKVFQEHLVDTLVCDYWGRAGVDT
ncbi:MAG: TIGR02679 family protein [Alicyclobacillus sp.]|nr:TIGR02679 family protein [Alicyclobacillus sp.]